jgi:hypothetical protein
MGEVHYLKKTPKVGASYEHRPRDWRFARDQREAGIDNLEWENRLPVLRPVLFWLAVIGSWAIFAGAIAMAAWLYAAIL